MKVSKCSLAAAVSNSGGLGVIASVGLVSETVSGEEYESSSAEALRIEIKKTRENTSKPFAVNIMGVLTNYDSLLHAASGNLEEGFCMCGDHAWRVDKIISVKELMSELF